MSSVAPETVPCGIHTVTDDRDPRGWRKSVACGGTCHVVSRSSFVEGEKPIVFYRCERCGHGTSRYADGKSLPAWDGILRDGTPYELSGADENDWRL